MIRPAENKKLKRTMKLLAHIFVPVIFGIAGYALLYAALEPVWELASAAGTLLIAESAPDFNGELDNIYDPNASKPPQAHAASTPAVDETPSAEPSLAPEPSFTPESSAGPSTAPGPTPTPRPHWDGPIPIGAITLPKSGTRYGQLTCSRIGLNSPVYWGDTNTVLRHGAGQYTGSFMPGFGRLILLSGHNTTYFRCFKSIREGDEVTFDTNYETYRYRIYGVEIMDKDELEMLLRSRLLGEQKETLLMYTCYPFHAIVGTKSQRIVVYGERIAGNDVQWRQ